VLQRIRDRNIWLIDAAILAVGVAYGMAISILAVFLHGRGYSEADIGVLAAWFALGIVSFSLPMGSLIRRFSARKTLIASLAGYAAMVALFPYVVDDFRLAALVRFFDGAASVGIWVSCETIVLDRAEIEQKAYVTTLYAVAIGIGYMVGPFLAQIVVAMATFAHVFLVAGVISLLTAGVVAARLDPDVEHESGGGPPSQTPVKRLAWKIKTSCFGTFAYGYFQSSVVLFLPLYLVGSKGVTEEDTILIPGFFALGMLLFTNIAGRLGDRFGHLLLMRVLGAAGTFTVLGFVMLDHYWLMCATVTIAGMTLAAISPISLALQGVIVDPPDYSRSNAIYNAFYAAGMLFGPPLSSRIFSAYGGAAMLYHLSALWAGFVLFTIVFWRDDPAVQRAPRSLEPSPSLPRSGGG
jgi:MFS family permease